MRIVQLLPTLSYGDGVGNDVLAIDRIIKEMGYATGIYAENIDPRIEKELVGYVEKMPRLKQQDILIYHLSTGTALNETLKDYSGKKLIVYHNVTPAHFFAKYSRTAFELCKRGREGISHLCDVADYCWADSAYNKQELQENGYPCRIDVVPIVIPFEDYEKEPDPTVLERYRDGRTNLIFVGRIAPNKKQEDVIRAFYYYKKYSDPTARLFLVGSYNGNERYYARLCSYIKRLGLSDVYITGHLRFAEILAYYRLADVFLCMSEHEGFCIPLVEAMYFRVPIVAYYATGVKETLGDAGFPLEDKDGRIAAEAVRMIKERQDLREAILARQDQRLKDFAYEKTRETIVRNLKGFIG